VRCKAVVSSKTAKRQPKLQKLPKGSQNCKKR
jgi:hypothetical protein